MIQEQLRKIIADAVDTDIKPDDITLEHPVDLSNGDFSSNIAMVLAKELRKNPKELAEELAEKIIRLTEKLKEIDRVEIAGPGFINFYLSREFFKESIKNVLDLKEKWGRNESLKGKKIMVEYTDPNPFKEFHVGHLMPNAIGESISRLIEFSGAEVKRANYQGDVGLHVAKAIWGLKQLKEFPENVSVIGEAYAAGAVAYTGNPNAKKEIDEINTLVYERSSEEINNLYDRGRKLSLDHFEELYEKLGTAFDYYFFESETGVIGKKIVEENKKIFEKSDGAVVFRGEEYNPNLHTRVFLNSEGLPTYEAKELGLVNAKLEKYKFDISITVTDMEQKEYFNVIKEVIRQIFPDISDSIKVITHGTMRLPSGKMSSRTGDVISGKSFLLQIEEEVQTKMKEFSADSKKESKKHVSEQIAVGAVKYSMLKQNIGKDIVFDIDQALSFKGDSGPYLQYTNARILSMLKKAKDDGISGDVKILPEENTDVERLLYRFPEIVELANMEYEPHYVTNYLIALAGAFNSWYGQTKILDGTDKVAYKLALAGAVSATLQNGLWLLGITAPKRM